MSDDRIPEAFALILVIAKRRGVRNINQLPGCWEFTAGAWQIAVNGHRDERTTTAGDKVPPFHVFATCDFFRAVLFSSFGGETCGNGAEDDLIAALRQEQDRDP